MINASSENPELIMKSTDRGMPCVITEKKYDWGRMVRNVRVHRSSRKKRLAGSRSLPAFSTIYGDNTTRRPRWLMSDPSM